jgi:2-(1,2-epoxy-1,2-dihydrophenyl)acetyl-CoA isomerase
MSDNEIVLQKLENGLLTITMNRPERRNALNPDMTRGLVEAARRAADDHEVRAVLLKGAGGTFCVGGDVKSMAEGRAPLAFEAKMANLRRGMEVSRILHQMPKPVVAQVDGAAAGAGLSIALACDLRVASASCKITTAFAKVDCPATSAALISSPGCSAAPRAANSSGLAGAVGAGPIISAW